MSAIDFEFGIKKDIRNNPIVREIDEARQRQLWQSVGLGLLLVVAVLFSGYQKLQLVWHGYEMESLQQDLSDQLELNRHLRLEVETLRSPRRIADLATHQLHLVEPARDQAIVIERVTASAPASRSLVAAAR